MSWCVGFGRLGETFGFWMQLKRVSLEEVGGSEDKAPAKDTGTVGFALSLVSWCDCG